VGASGHILLIECFQSQSLNTCKRVGASSHILLIECFQSQSLNACKRVGVSGHVLELFDTWELSTMSLRKSVSQERQATRKEFLWVGTTFGEGKKDILELVQPWRDNFGL